MMSRTNKQKDNLSVRCLRCMGMRHSCSCLGAVALMTVVLFMFLGYYDIVMETEMRTNGTGSRENINMKSDLAIVYAAPNYHMEVASAVSCLLHSLGKRVVVYVDNKISIHFSLWKPFSQNWLKDCASLYGHCVSEWVDLSLFGYLRKEVPHEDTIPSMIVFITFPFKVRPWHSVISGAEPVEDPTALDLLRRYFTNERSEKRPQIVLVTHNVREMDCTNEYIQNILSIVPQNYIHFLLLSEHTKIAGLKRYKQTLKDAMSIESGDFMEMKSGLVDQLLPDPPSTEYFFPIMPMRFIDFISLAADEDRPFKFASLVPERPPPKWRSDGLSFAIQGSFGGKSAFRRNLSYVMNCFHALESSGEVSAALHRLRPSAAPPSLSSPSPPSALRVGARSTNGSRVLLQSESAAKESQLVINLIGRISEPFDWKLGQNLKHATVKFQSNLRPRDFYRSIHSSQYLIAAIDNREYFELRASSSIPAAFIARVPIVATRELLDLYPCIRDMPIHRRLNLRTSCESIAAALSLTPEEYSQAQHELLTCGTQLWEKSQEVFKKLSVAGGGSMY